MSRPGGPPPRGAKPFLRTPGRAAGALLILLVLAAGAWALWRPRPAPPAFALPPALGYRDRTNETFLQFQHHQSRTPRTVADVMGSGVAWGDVDGDGREDVFLFNGSGTDPAHPAYSALFRNTPAGFVNATAAASTPGAELLRPHWGMGALFADLNNDGREDLIVTEIGQVHLYRNDGKGRFTDVTAGSGIKGNGFWTSVAAADYDGDGLLDLYICRYGMPGEFKERPDVRKATEGVYLPPSLNPLSYRGAPNVLYHNDGNLHFTDRTRAAGVGGGDRRSLQAVWIDLNGDGRPDLVVANDLQPNLCFLNLDGARFQDVSFRSYLADPRSNMGIAVADYNGDGRPDLFITHWVSEGNALFRNRLLARGGGPAALAFSDEADQAGLHEPSLALVGFGACFVDADNDGRPDLIVVNGHTNPTVEHLDALIPFPPSWFHNNGHGGFDSSAPASGDVTAEPFVGRGLAAADYDGDGRVDLIATASNGRARLWHNETPDAGRWIALRLVGRTSNRDAIGACLAVTAGGRTQWRWITAGDSYLSESSRIQTVGLGPAMEADQVEIWWPSGRHQILRHLKGDQLHRIIEP